MFPHLISDALVLDDPDKPAFEVRKRHVVNDTITPDDANGPAGCPVTSDKPVPIPALIGALVLTDSGSYWQRGRYHDQPSEGG
jgi:hypothetical protein